MQKQEFVAYLSQNPEQFGFQEREQDGLPGVLVENKSFQTKTFFSEENISAKELAPLLVATHQGRNVEHITRVTGYFSKVSGWNVGKKAELADRHRTPIS
ncbi:MAG: anaerobic ribonucleoside-triphosphate reductase [Candidatus Ratteibacteria bacterium]